MKIAAFAQEKSACTGYRLIDPLTRAKQLKLADVFFVEAPNENTETNILSADIVYFGRAASPNILNMIDKIHTAGKKVAFDLDDSIFDISPHSHHYGKLGIMAINMDTADGESAVMWKDGEKDFNIRANRNFRGHFINVLRAVDLVTVTTEPLRILYSKFNRNVQIVPNSINMATWKTETKQFDTPVKILYTGAANHLPHMLDFMPVLEEIQAKYSNVRIAFIGTDWKMVPNKLDYKRVDVYPWVSYEAYPYLLKTVNADIGVAPISDDFFDDCRSAIKWYEYSALNLPTVASNYGPYKREIVDGQTGLLVHSNSDWVAGLSKLIESKDLRNKIAANAKKEVASNHNIDYTADLWVETFKNTIEVK